MEGISSTLYNGIRGYWRRKGYRRLTGSTRRRRKMPVVELGSVSGESGSVRRRRFWRIKLTRRLNLRIRFSPKKLLLGLRDAYVNMMLRVANTRVVAGGFGGGFAGNGVAGFGMRAVKEYDEKMIVEIYRSIVVAQGQLAPRDAAWIGAALACPRY